MDFKDLGSNANWISRQNLNFGKNKKGDANDASTPETAATNTQPTAPKADASDVLFAGLDAQASQFKQQLNPINFGKVDSATVARVAASIQQFETVHSDVADVLQELGRPVSKDAQARITFGTLNRLNPS